MGGTAGDSIVQKEDMKVDAYGKSMVQQEELASLLPEASDEEKTEAKAVAKVAAAAYGQVEIAQKDNTKVDTYGHYVVQQEELASVLPEASDEDKIEAKAVAEEAAAAYGQVEVQEHLHDQALMQDLPKVRSDVNCVPLVKPFLQAGQVSSVETAEVKAVVKTAKRAHTQEEHGQEDVVKAGQKK